MIVSEDCHKNRLKKVLKGTYMKHVQGLETACVQNILLSLTQEECVYMAERTRGGSYVWLPVIISNPNQCGTNVLRYQFCK